MEYIDWIISSVIFLIVISFVIITLPQTLDLTDNQTPDISANTISFEIADFYDQYTVKLNNTDQENYPFRLKIDENTIKSNNPIIKDNYVYGTINKQTELYANEKLTDTKNTLGTKVIDESFLNGEFNYFDVNFGNTPTNMYDTIYLEANTQLISKKEFRDVIGVIDFMGSSLNIKFNYNEDTNSYYECEIKNNQQTLKEISNGIIIDSETNNIITTKSWKKVYFGSNKLSKISFCYVDKTTNLDLNSTIDVGKIIIENTDTINISKILGFESNDLHSKSADKTIESNEFYVEIEDTNANISFLKINYNLSFDFSEILVVPDSKEIAIIKNNTEKEKLIFFSQTKEFWAFKDETDSLIIDLDYNLGIDLDVNFTEDLKLWLDASSLSLNDNDLVSSWTDLSGNDNHAIQDNDGNKPVFKENILNGKPAILFNNSALLTENNFSLNDWTIFVLFKDHSTVSTFERILDHSYTNGFWLGRNGSSANSWGGGVKETSVPYGRFISIPDEQWHIIQNIREGTTHKIISGTEEVTGTVTSTTTSENTIAIGSWNSLNVDQRATDMHISEILLFNSALSDSNRLLVENYLSQKYDLDVNSGVNFENKKIELIDLNTNRKKIIIDFFDSNTNLPIDCNYTYKNNKITINSCSNDALIKIRSRDLEVTDYTDYPNINIIKNKERVVFEEYINNLDPNNYFLEIKDQKTIDLKKGREINMENKIYSNYFKYIDNFGNNYLVNLLIKPFNFAIDTNTPDIESGIVTYYDFRDNKSLILKDKITDNDGNIFGSNIIDFYKKENIITNNSGYFNGSDTYVRIPTKDFNGDSGTINIWVKPITITPQTMIFGHQLITNRLYIGFSASSVLSLGVSTAAAINTNAVVLENEWSNLTLTYDSGNYYFYKNGVLTKTGTYTGNIIFQGYADLGWAGNSGWTNKFNGYLGETRIYNRSLDSSEISYLYTKKEKEYR
jgi:hypothetical protein